MPAATPVAGRAGGSTNPASITATSVCPSASVGVTSPEAAGYVGTTDPIGAGILA